MNTTKTKLKSGVYSYSIYLDDFTILTYSMSDLFTLNTTIATCKYLNNRNFKNIVIDLGFEPYCNVRPKLLHAKDSFIKFYVVGESRKDSFKAFYTNSIIDILTFVRENLRADSERFQVIQIVNCKESIKG